MTATPENPPTNESQPGAALLREADRLASSLDDYRHHMNNSPYTGTDEARTVQATVTASFEVIELIIEDELLPLGAEVVAQRVTEALLNAQAAATTGRQDGAGKLSEALGLTAALKERFDAAINGIEPDRAVRSSGPKDA